MGKIVIDARIINSSTGRYIERLLTYLQDIDKENEYIVLVPKKDLKFWQPKNKKFTIQEANFANYSLAEQFSLNRLLRRLKPDLVHFCMPQQPLLYRGLHVTTIHDTTLLKTYSSDKNWLVYHFKQLVGRLVFWWIGRSSQHIMVPSLFTRRDYLDFAKIDAKKVSVIYEAADTNQFTPVKIDLPQKEFILYVGQQSDYKNIRRLIQAHQLLLEKRPNLGLVLVGSKSAPHTRNEAWVVQKGYKNIHFTGFVSDAQLTWLYQKCQAYVFPSLMEGFGLPALEAMSQGAPVVSSDASCLPEVYGKAALYFNPHSTLDMAQKIAQALDNPALRKTLIADGHQRVKRYDWRTTAQRTYEVYQKALNEK